jgi:hypothetical protein
MHADLVNATLHNERAMSPYPDYVGPEEGQDLEEDWEAAAAASPFIRRVGPEPQEPAKGDVQ